MKWQLLYECNNKSYSRLKIEPGFRFYRFKMVPSRFLTDMSHFIICVEKYLFELSKIEHTSSKQQSDSNRIFTGYIPVQYQISGYLKYIQNCAATGMEHPRCSIRSLTRENKTKHKNKSNHGGQKTTVVALKNDQIENRIYGGNVKNYARYDGAFRFEWNAPQVFLILYFLRFQTFSKTRFRVGLQTETCYFHHSSSSYMKQIDTEYITCSHIR